MAKASAAAVTVGDIDVRVSSPDRVIFEATEWTLELTKLDVAQYFADVAEPLHRAIGGRPTTLERWPDGYRAGMTLGEEGFYSKRLPKGAPEWVETVRITTPTGRPIDELLPNLAAPVWAAQMGALTLHPWPVRAPDVDHPDELRLDFDPEPGTTLDDVKRVALAARDLLAELGVPSFVKTSGSRGLHVFVRLAATHSFADVRHAAIGIGDELVRRDPDGVTMSWWKEERGSKIFVDFNQNNRDRTIASAYSLRARLGAPVSTPLTWDEVEALTDLRVYNLTTVPELVATRDPWATIEDVAVDLAPLLELWNGVERVFPPEFPKMPGEPPRVQPSRAAHHDD